MLMFCVLFFICLLLSRYVQYNPTSLERSYKFELLTEHDLGVPIDLIDPEAYRIDPNGKAVRTTQYRYFSYLETEHTLQTHSPEMNIGWLDVEI